MKHPAALARLIDALHGLPGIGPKTAQRLAFRLLQDGRSEARELSLALDGALEVVGRCGRCRMLAEGELCPLCESATRDDALLCVVESPADVIAVENSGAYRGRYFVLMGISRRWMASDLRSWGSMNWICCWRKGASAKSSLRRTPQSRAKRPRM